MPPPASPEGLVPDEDRVVRRVEADRTAEVRLVRARALGSAVLEGHGEQPERGRRDFLTDRDDARDAGLVGEAEAQPAGPLAAEDQPRPALGFLDLVGRDAGEHERVAHGALPGAAEVRGGLPGEAHRTVVVEPHRGADPQRQVDRPGVLARDPLQEGVVVVVRDHHARIHRSVRIHADAAKERPLVEAIVDLPDDLVHEQGRDATHDHGLSARHSGGPVARRHLAPVAATSIAR